MNLRCCRLRAQAMWCCRRRRRRLMETPPRRRVKVRKTTVFPPMGLFWCCSVFFCASCCFALSMSVVVRGEARRRLGKQPRDEASFLCPPSPPSDDGGREGARVDRPSNFNTAIDRGSEQNDRDRRYLFGRPTEEHIQRDLPTKKKHVPPPPPPPPNHIAGKKSCAIEIFLVN